MRRDQTDIRVNGEMMVLLKVKSGIKQGCTGSPQLFLMIVNIIIKEIQKTGISFKNENSYIPTLFCADDGMLMATRVREIEQMIEVLMEVAEVAGLKINVEKCKTMILQRRKNLTINQIRRIEVVNELKYLGMTMNNTSGCFR